MIIITAFTARFRGTTWNLSGTSGGTALQGARATAERYSARLREEVEPGRRAWAAYQQAHIAALLGDEEEALALLGEAAADVYSPFWLHRDEAWEAMRGKPEIQRMMRPWEEPHPTDEIALFD